MKLTILEGIIVITLLLFLLFAALSTSYGEKVYVSDIKSFIGVLNLESKRCHAGVVFACKDEAAELPVLEIHCPYSRKALEAFVDKTREMAHELSLSWLQLTGSSTVFIFDCGRDREDIKDDSIIFVFDRGDFVEPPTMS